MKIKNRIIIVALAFLFITSLQVLVNFTYGTCAEQRGKSSETYPTTPEGVVEAFCKVGFEIKDIEKFVYAGDVGERYQYTKEDFSAGCDGSTIILCYRVIKIKEGQDKSQIKVIYECIGDISALEFLTIERKTKEIIYEVKKDKGLWKIASPYDCPHISVRTAIKISEYGIKVHPELKEKIRENVSILKKYL